MHPMKQVNYGFDAPGIMRGLVGFGSLVISTGIAMPVFFDNGLLKCFCYFILVVGSVLFVLGLAMFAYGLKGKYRTRDLMLNKINWSGDEKVLDIGTGQGLLMNGAAKRLTTGKSIGIDIWSSKDLSDNSIERTLLNAELEGVSNKIEIKNDDARNLSFEDNSFDVVLSLLCIHNIEPKEDQRKACFEIARVLKPKGVAIIGDYVPTTEYAKAFAEAGLKVKSSKTYFTTALALMWIVEATKE
jgi:ubiquinone/menaquinone biosynthesis C-methylase UbiE